MKTVIITNYITGLCSFLDSKGIKWEQHLDQKISFEIESDEQLFNLGREFEEFNQNEF